MDTDITPTPMSCRHKCDYNSEESKKTSVITTMKSLSNLANNVWWKELETEKQKKERSSSWLDMWLRPFQIWTEPEVRWKKKKEEIAYEVIVFTENYFDCQRLWDVWWVD